MKAYKVKVSPRSTPIWIGKDLFRSNQVYVVDELVYSSLIEYGKLIEEIDLTPKPPQQEKKVKPSKEETKEEK
jgi:hypothetical protein